MTSVLLNLVDSGAGTPTLCASMSDWEVAAFGDAEGVGVDCEGQSVQVAIAPDLAIAEAIVAPLADR